MRFILCLLFEKKGDTNPWRGGVPARVLVQLQHPDNRTAEDVATDAASNNDEFHGVLLFYEKNGDTMTLAGNDIPAGWL